jgi:hypothetical protein
MSAPRAASSRHPVPTKGRGATRAAALLATLLAGCGVKAPPRPPLPEKAEARAPVAAVEEDCGCAAPLLPFLATTTTTATQANP